MDTRRIKALLPILLFSLAINTPILAQNSSRFIAKNIAGNLYASLMQQRGWPSLSIAIVLDQKMIYSQAFGYADVDKKITCNDKNNLSRRFHDKAV